MTTDPHTHRIADAALRSALADFLRAADPEPAAALPTVVGLARAVGGLTRLAMDVVLDRSAPDPIHLAPRILRAA